MWELQITSDINSGSWNLVAHKCVIIAAFVLTQPVAISYICNSTTLRWGTKPCMLTVSSTVIGVQLRRTVWRPRAGWIFQTRPAGWGRRRRPPPVFHLPSPPSECRVDWRVGRGFGSGDVDGCAYGVEVAVERRRRCACRVERRRRAVSREPVRLTVRQYLSQWTTTSGPEPTWAVRWNYTYPLHRPVEGTVKLAMCFTFTCAGNWYDFDGGQPMFALMVYIRGKSKQLVCCSQPNKITRNQSFGMWREVRNGRNRIRYLEVCHGTRASRARPTTIINSSWNHIHIWICPHNMLKLEYQTSQARNLSPFQVMAAKAKKTTSITTKPRVRSYNCNSTKQEYDH
jgi:hypothetical protein